MSPRQSHERRVSERIKSQPTINYYPEFDPDIYSIEGEHVPHGKHHPGDIEERLEILNKQAQKLGFSSLLDATLAEARQYDSNVGSRENLDTFENAGCLEELMTIFHNCFQDSQRRLLEPKIETVTHPSEAVYIEEFNALRKLDVLNLPLKNWKP